MSSHLLSVLWSLLLAGMFLVSASLVLRRIDDADLGWDGVVGLSVLVILLFVGSGLCLALASRNIKKIDEEK